MKLLQQLCVLPAFRQICCCEYVFSRLRLCSKAACRWCRTLIACLALCAAAIGGLLATAGSPTFFLFLSRAAVMGSYTTLYVYTPEVSVPPLSLAPPHHMQSALKAVCSHGQSTLRAFTRACPPHPQGT